VKGTVGKFQYVNLNYSILAMAVSVITGKAFSTIVRELIFDPFGLSSAHFNFESCPRGFSQAGAFDRKTRKEMFPKDFPAHWCGYMGSDCLVMTISDVSKFVAGLYQLLPTLDKVKLPDSDVDGFFYLDGFYIGNDSAWISGASWPDGFMTFSRIYDKTGESITMCCNCLNDFEQAGTYCDMV
jgi:CubicO group peptidase (beta-lactamase class C family)